MTPELTDEERAALLKEESEADAEDARAMKAHGDLCMRLRSRFRKELGRRGQAWEMVNETTNTGGVGPIVVKKPDLSAHKMFQARLAKGESSTEDEIAYVSGGIVYPDKPQWNAIVASDMPQLVSRVCVAVTALFGFEEEKKRGK